MSQITKCINVFKEFNQENYVETFHEDEQAIAEFSSDSEQENQTYVTVLNNSQIRTACKKRCKAIPPSCASQKPLSCLQIVRNPSKRKRFTDESGLHFDTTSKAKKLCTETIIVELTRTNNNSNGDEQEMKIIWSSSDSEEIADTTSAEVVFENTQNAESTELFSKLKNPFRRCRRSGYLKKLQQEITKNKLEQRYLKSDRKFGLRSGIELRVQKMEESFGVHIITVAAENRFTWLLVIDAEMAKEISINSKLVAFFDDSYKPYAINRHKEEETIFVQPHKLIVVEDDAFTAVD